MKQKSHARRHVLAVVAAVITLGGGTIALVMADSAGAVASAEPKALTSNTHIVPMGAATGTGSSASTRVTTAGAGPISSASTAVSAPAGAGPTSSASTAVSAPASVRTSAEPASGGRGQLAATQLPAAVAEKWSPVGASSTRSIAGHDIGENECAKVDGASVWIQQAFSGGDGQNVAIQDTFTFADADSAQTAYQGLVTGMNGCQQTTRALQVANKAPLDAKVMRTADSAQADAWERNWTGVMGMSAEGPQTNHFYLAVNGSRLIVLQFTEFPGQAAPYDIAGDGQVLAELTAELAA